MAITWYMVLEISTATEIFFVIFGHFLPFYPPNSPIIENITKLKKTPEDIIILHQCTKIHDHSLYCSWDIVCAGCNCYFWFWTIFYPFIPLTAPKNKISKKGKNIWRYHHFTHLYKKLWLNDVRFLRYGGQQVDGQKKWHIEVGAPPKNFITLKYQVMIFYKNVININFSWHRSQGFLRQGGRETGIFCLPH